MDTQEQSPLGVLPPELLCHIISMLPMAEQLRSVRVCKYWNAIVRYYLGEVGPLVDGTVFSNTPSSLMCTLRKDLTRMKSLILSNCSYVDDTFLSCFLSRCDSVKHIDLTGCSHITDKSLEQIASHCQQITIASRLSPYNCRRNCKNEQSLAGSKAAKPQGTLP